MQSPTPASTTDSRSPDADAPVVAPRLAGELARRGRGTTLSTRRASSPAKRGVPTTTSGPRSTLPELRSFLVHLASERGLAPNTLLAYRRDLDDADAWFAGRGKHLLSADADLYRAYLQDQTLKGQATKTIARRLAAFRVFLKFAQTQGHDTEPVLRQLERPKPERSLPKVLGRALVLQLLAAVDPRSPLFHRDVAIVELLYASGLRASELCTVRVRDVIFSQQVVRVLGKGSKERIVPFGTAAAESMTRYLDELRPALDRHGSDVMFLSRTGRPLERVALWQLVDKLARAGGLYKRVSPHVLRHCFASHLLSGGADLRVVQELLGHADIGTTQIYTHVDQSRLKAIHEKYHPRR